VAASPGTNITYRLVGHIPAVWFFNVNAASGVLYLTRSLQEDAAELSVYSLLLEADRWSSSAVVKATVAINITVDREADPLAFGQASYSIWVSANHSVGSEVARLATRGNRADGVLFSMHAYGDNQSDAYFAILPTTGSIISINSLLGVSGRTLTFIATVCTTHTWNVCCLSVGLCCVLP